MIDIFLAFFGNVFNVLMIIMFLGFGFILGLLLKPRWGNVVMKLIPHEHRFVDFPIEEETAVSVICGPVKGFAPHRFFKFAPGWTGTVGRFVKRLQVRYLGKEGTAYTWYVKESKDTKVEIGSLANALRTLWPQEFIDYIAPEYWGLVESSKIMVTVNVSEGLTPKDFETVTEEDIKTEEDRKSAQTYWEGKTKEERHVMMNNMIWAVAGFGIACLLMVIGVLRIPTAAAVLTNALASVI